MIHETEWTQNTNLEYNLIWTGQKDYQIIHVIGVNIYFLFFFFYYYFSHQQKKKLVLKNIRLLNGRILKHCEGQLKVGALCYSELSYISYFFYAFSWVKIELKNVWKSWKRFLEFLLCDVLCCVYTNIVNFV